MSPIDAYVDALPEPVRARFAALADAVRAEAPDATERLSYGMPTWHLRENLVHLGAAKRHIGVYPGPEAILAVSDALTGFKTSKGAIQIPHDAPLPLDLLRRVVRWRLDAVAAKAR